MAGPVNIRAFAPIPFPAGVAGGQAIKITKANGIWTVALDIAGLGANVPLAQFFNTDFVPVYDSIQNTIFKMPLSATGFGGSRLQRVALASPIVVAANDQIINFNINAGAPTCVVPLSTLRNGVPLTFKDAGGHAAAHNLTITFTGGQLADGLAQVVMNTNFGELTLRPYNDLTNTGYSIL